MFQNPYHVEIKGSSHWNGNPKVKWEKAFPQWLNTKLILPKLPEGYGFESYSNHPVDPVALNSDASQLREDPSQDGVRTTDQYDASVPSSNDQPSFGLKGQSPAGDLDAQNQDKASSVFADTEIPGSFAPEES